MVKLCGVHHVDFQVSNSLLVISSNTTKDDDDRAIFHEKIERQERMIP